MKIHNIRIKGLQQYRDTFIDFTNPETGAPLKKICFIGRNGTGKSTLLSLLSTILKYFDRNGMAMQTLNFNCAVNLKFEYDSKSYNYFMREHFAVIFNAEIDVDKPNWFEEIAVPDKFVFEDNYNAKGFAAYVIQDYHMLFNQIALKDNANDLLIYSPAESATNSHLYLWDVPATNLNDALTLFRNFPFFHEITNETVSDFWKILVFLIKKRENERDAFENQEQNLHKTKSILIEEFERINPKVLDRIAELWNTILGNAGLEFDVERARNPIQLTDNLSAYIVLRNTKERVSYNSLSTGIRNFIFRVGHIYSLYFNRKVERGFVLIDEPENSLFPDFLFDLVSIYESIITDKNKENNTQLFMATHNPIIAAQFEPYERIILEWDEDGYVQAHKGVAPVGDDPNDILLKDFKLSHVMGAKGQEFWNLYLELKKKLRKSENEQEKAILVKEISEIGSKYNFQ